MSPENAQFFSKLIERELGIIYSDFNLFQLQNRLEEIVRILGLKDVQELQNKAQGQMTSTMKQLLLDIATNNETSFFRDPKMFKMVASELFPRYKDKALRVWSAACSTGQEPYSLTMLAKEHAPSITLEIVATDISARVLKRAEDARYSQLEVQRGLPAPLLIKYFSKDATDHWVVQPALRSLVRFQPCNLLSSFDHLGLFDLILCRNVLIYQNVESKMKIIEKLVRSLRPGGTLVLGAGESMIGLSDAFESVQNEQVIYYRLKNKIAA